MSTYPRCSFKVRVPAGDGRYRFETVEQHSYFGGTMPLQHPPATGVLVTLYDIRGEGFQPDGGPVFRVIDQMWSHPAYGSGGWPYGMQEPREGPLVDIIVEPAAGLYADETPICAESTCERYLSNGSWVMPRGEEDRAVLHEHLPWEPKP